MEDINELKESKRPEESSGRGKNIFLTLLILITFIVAMLLYFFSVFGTYRDSEIGPEEGGDTEWVHPIGRPPDKYEPINPPIGSINSVSLTWPTISTNELSKAVITYDGYFDINIFESKFENEFNNSYTGIDHDTYTFDYEYIDGKYAKVDVDSNIKYDGINMITNPTHTYYYELIENI